ncbi:ABC-type transporter, periplasmic subunit (plasmid) [Deinococcus proteolyticus MRP]|uniref:ABC-type transporter, periplasmic subunit n=1 Tax=Deinococcus proteolyticus (strain ATCC 35074 / DSM 20540 / JCM 6276 / NBRC 101906 / NCIMB 13154 / VKM Ac-1939 / CCM 2703 / MRP) TaxID=693977 RepID=F0RR10_DEIPM|nr:MULTISPECIES: ABC transporter substrate-binding protein [Deinococcus]ADY27719.1 ABC-type transporter, periplasmic subunit [Deinococcus proteolyticus MRP]MCY1703482.1 ABC transporter substrate-binding protein [Deinococcus sp. SL84]
MTHKTLAAALLLALSTAAQATSYPLTVTDDLGRRVVLKKEPMRIVAMLPSHTETLIAIGAGGKLVGIDEYSNYPKNVTDNITKVGNGFQPNIEKIVALKPDLVLADESSSSRLTARLEAAGLTVYGGTAQTYNEVFQKIVVLGRLTNRESGATRLVSSMRRDLSALERTVVNRPKVSTYYEVDPTPYSVGPNSFIGTLMTRAGGRTIVPASLGDFPKIDPELIVRSNPQVMIGLTPEEARRRPGWQNLQAVRAGRVYKPTAAERDALSRPGPRLPQAMRALIRMIHPEALK